MALHDRYVNRKDRQELADAALWPAVTGFCRGGGWELGAIVYFWPTWVCYDHPLPRFGWSVAALHDLLLYIIRTHHELDDAGTQGACGLSPWLPGMGISRLALAAGKSFWGYGWGN